MSEHQDKTESTHSVNPDRVDGHSSKESSSGQSFPKHSSSEKASSVSPKPSIRYAVGEEPTIVSKNILAADSNHHPLLSPSELATSLIGEKLGHFELQEIIGGGGMGTVFRARDTLLDRVVAVKILSQSHSANDETRARFVNEAQSAARLDHENIARVYFIGEDQGVHYIVYEYINGTNIRDLVIQRGPLPIFDTIRFMLQMGEALTHAAKRNVVHRDIKPSNILVTDEGQAYLVDMGLARLHQVEHSGDDLTASGVTLGTFDYISPEQARDPRSADVRSDLYSLGCTLYFMLAGNPPFPDGTVLQKLLQHQGDDLPDLQLVRSDIPPELLHILNKLCVKSPKKRYQTPLDLIKDLASLAERIGISTISHSKYLLPEQPAKIRFITRHLPWIVPCGILIVACVLLVVFKSTDQNQAAANHWDSMSESYSQLQPLEKSRAKNKKEDKKQNLPNSNKTDIESSKNDNVNTSKKDAENSTTPDEPLKKESDSVDPDNDTPVTNTPEIDDPSIDNLQTGRILYDRKRRAVGIIPMNPEADLSVAEKQSFGLTTGTDLKGKENQLSVNDGSDSGKVAPTNTEDSTNSSNNDKKIIIVGDSKDAHYGSVREALSHLRSGDSIELQYNGRRVEKPFTVNLDSKKPWNLEVFAGKGFRPAIQFLPKASKPDQNPRDMITVVNGTLSFTGIDLEMQLPKQIAQRWSMFALQSARGLHLTHCTLTISNATSSRFSRHPDVAFLRTTTSEQMDKMMKEEEAIPKKLPHLIVQLNQCIARGEADFLASNQLQPIRFSWDNGLLVTTENMFIIEGLAEKPKQSGYLIVNLSHTTVSALSGLFSAINTRQLPYQRDIRFTSSYNIFIGSLDQSITSALISQGGIDTTQASISRFHYEGDSNFYEGYDQLWEIHSDADDSQQSFDFEKWNEHWKKKSGRTLFSYQNKVDWQQQATTKTPIHQHTVKDYLLSDTENETTKVDKKREWDAGFNAKQLPKFPRFPVKPVSDTPKSSDSTDKASG